MISGTALISLPMAGIPLAAASSYTMPNASWRAGMTNASARRHSSRQRSLYGVTPPVTVTPAWQCVGRKGPIGHNVEVGRVRKSPFVPGLEAAPRHLCGETRRQ